jgi:hypothetical protein
MDQERLQQLIDACRPGRNDLREPELAALADHLAHDADAAAAYERNQRFDAAVGAAFRDAPVPAGLEERLLAAVGATPSISTDLEQIDSPVKGRRLRISRRWFWGSAAAIAASIFVAVVVGHFRTVPEVTPDELVAQTQVVLDDADFRRPEAWKPVSEDGLRRFPTRYLKMGPDGWRRTDAGVDGRAIAYRIPVRNKTAYLFVISPKGSPVGLTGAPSGLSGATGGWKMAAWTAGGVIYVLAFNDDLRALLSTPPTA